VYTREKRANRRWRNRVGSSRRLLPTKGKGKEPLCHKKTANGAHEIFNSSEGATDQGEEYEGKKRSTEKADFWKYKEKRRAETPPRKRVTG